MKINRNEKSIIVEFESDMEFMEGLFFEVIPDGYINPKPPSLVNINDI